MPPFPWPLMGSRLSPDPNPTGFSHNLCLLIRSDFAIAPVNSRFSSLHHRQIQVHSASPHLCHRPPVLVPTLDPDLHDGTLLRQPAQMLTSELPPRSLRKFRGINAVEPYLVRTSPIGSQTTTHPQGVAVMDVQHPAAVHHGTHLDGPFGLGIEEGDKMVDSLPQEHSGNQPEWPGSLHGIGESSALCVNTWRNSVTDESISLYTVKAIAARPSRSLAGWQFTRI